MFWRQNIIASLHVYNFKLMYFINKSILFQIYFCTNVILNYPFNIFYNL